MFFVFIFIWSLTIVSHFFLFYKKSKLEFVFLPFVRILCVKLREIVIFYIYVMVKRYEKSSWGIVYRKKNGKIEILLLKWTNSKWEEELVIPKGHIEDGEIAKETAVREISEETGLMDKDLEIIKFMTKLSYTFTAGHLENNPVIDKDVYLFLVRYNGTAEPIVRKEERFTGYIWLEINEVKTIDVKFDLVWLVGKNKVYFI